MTDPNVTETVIDQGKALVRAIEPTGPFKRAIAGLLLTGYKRRLRALVAVLPGWVTEEILSASQHIGKDRAAVWFGEN